MTFSLAPTAAAHMPRATDQPVKIAVLDYDAGNLHSACKGLSRAGAEVSITDSSQEIAAAEAIVLPGVGAFDPSIRNLRTRGLEQPIRQAIAQGKPFLGICIGLQLLLETSEEGREPGLGIVPGQVRRLVPEAGLTIPHMGWNQLDWQQPATQAELGRGMGDRPWVYFVHSYYALPTDAAIVAATTCHGSQAIAAALHGDPLGCGRANLTAVQFHPEKSSQAGLQLLANFTAAVRASRRP